MLLRPIGMTGWKRGGVVRQSGSNWRYSVTSILRLYKEWGLGLVYNPVFQIRRPSAGQGRNRRLSWSKAGRMLKACDAHSNPMLGWAVRIALHTAMRQGELLSLTLDQVDLQRRVVRLNESKNGSARTAPLSKRAVRVLRQANGVCPVIKRVEANLRNPAFDDARILAG
jgi:integrase